MPAGLSAYTGKSIKQGKVEEWVATRSFCHGVKAGIETSNDIERLIEPTIRDLGFDLVIARIVGGGRRTLQVMIEPLDRERATTVEDCVEVSHAVSAMLDVADPIAGRYTLEVSSPGLDRPLVREADFERFKGRKARIELAEAIDGRKRFKGVLLGLVDESRLRLGSEDGEIEFPLAAVRKAKLDIEDDLTSAGKRGAPAAGAATEEPGR